MSTYGWLSPNWSSSWKFFGFNTSNNIAAGGGMPEAGTITAVSFNCDALSGSGSGMTAVGCVWTTGGSLLGHGSTVNLNYANAHAGPYTWHTSTGLSLAMTAGENFYMGWWRLPSSGAGDNIWGYANGGTEYQGTTANSTSPGAFSQNATATDQIGVYVTYTPSGVGPPAAPNVLNAQDQQFIYHAIEDGLISL
jgi:hypothetical protein